ncbi:sporulation-specific protein 22 [Rhizina undulata]
MPHLDAPDPGMATLQRRIKSLTASSAEIHRDLISNPSTATLDIRLEEHIKLADKCAAAREHMRLKDEYEELDALGTQLWNLSTNLSREGDGHNGGDGSESRKRRVLNVRVLAFHLLACSWPSAGRKLQNTVRLFKVAIKAGKTCLEHRELHWAGRVIEKAAVYHEEISKSANVSPAPSAEESQMHARLSSEYFILRTSLAWRQANFSMADYMYSKATEGKQLLLDPRTSESLADVLYDIGNDFLLQNAFDAATKWLQRSFDLLNNVDPVCLSESGGELRLAVTHSLVKAFIGRAVEGDFDRARNVLDIMSDEWPTRLTVYLLKLDLTLAEDPENCQGYYEILSRMISIAQLTEPIFKAILGKIHVLVSKKSTRLACDCLDELLTKRLLSWENDDWIEKSFVTRLWVTVQDPSSHEEAVLTALQKLLDSMTKQLARPFSAKATHAAQILLWKVTEAFYAQEKYQTAISWCKTALHPIFNRSGELNSAKIARRIILCALQTKDYGTAAEIFNEMPETAQDVPFTRFLMFKVAMRTSDDDLAQSCLKSLAECQDSDRRLLYACALDAQDIGNRKQALNALKMVLQKLDVIAPEIGHIPAILRCTIRLTMAEIECSKDGSANVESLCFLYEKAAEQAKKSRKSRVADKRREITFTIKELDWFSRNGYNLGLRSIVEWTPATSMRIFSTCIRFLELYPDDIDTNSLSEISYRKLLCYYMCASISTELGRIEDSTELQLQHYLNARRHVQDFCEKRETVQGRSEEELQDLTEKYASLLEYDFEAAVNLRAWESLSEIIEQTTSCGKKTTRILEIMADIILCSGAPNRTVLITLQDILNRTVPSPYGDITKLSRWIRSLVQVSVVKDTKATEALLLQVMDLARNAKEGKRYPDDEMQWLTGKMSLFMKFWGYGVDEVIATAWNRSIDFYCTSDTANAKRFAELALSLAGMLDDGGNTLKFLQNKYLEYNWS